MDKTIKLLEEFLKDYTMEGACGFWVQPDEEGGIPSVYIILDLDWLQSIETKPDFVARRMRQGLKEDIKNWTGIEVSYVGSTAKKCDGLNESVSTTLKRRLNYDSLKNDIQNILEYEINPNHYSHVGDFISDVCDWMVTNISDDMQYEHNIKIESKDKDKLYHFFVDNFGKMIAEYYVKEKGKLKESKKRIIVTESQYNRLFEQKISKNEMFQDLINDKLNYFKAHCDNNSSESFPNDISFSSCDSIELVESVNVDEVQKMTGARTDMYGNMYDSTPSIYVKLTINYWSIKGSHDFDDLIYDLKHILRNSTGGLPIVLDYKINNINKIKE